LRKAGPAKTDIRGLPGETIVRRFKELACTHIAVDPGGQRSTGMNEVLK